MDIVQMMADYGATVRLRELLDQVAEIAAAFPKVLAAVAVDNPIINVVIAKHPNATKKADKSTAKKKRLKETHKKAIGESVKQFYATHPEECKRIGKRVKKWWADHPEMRRIIGSKVRRKMLRRRVSRKDVSRRMKR